MSKLSFRNPQDAFDEAIDSGRLSRENREEFMSGSDNNYVGNYMYMGTDENGKDLFKNIVTRKYID